MDSTVLLNDGNRMPRVGLGTFQGNYDYSAQHAAVVASVRDAIDAGYRHFDTAFLYDTERGVGEAIASKVNEGVVSREQLFVTTKLWCTSHRRDLVVPALRESLQALDLQYVDMFLVHWPCALKPGKEPFPKDEQGELIFEDDTVDITETWKGMVECKELGLTRSIGVSNFTIAQIQRILDMGSIRPANCQIEVNPFFLNESMVEFCMRERIQVSCFSPLHKPHRTWAKPDDPFIATDETLLSLGRKYNKSPVQVALRFQLQRDLVVLPKSNSPEHLRENIAIFDFELSPEDFESIRLNCGGRNARVLSLHVLGASKEYPFKDELPPS